MANKISEIIPPEMFMLGPNYIQHFPYDSCTIQEEFTQTKKVKQLRFTTTPKQTRTSIATATATCVISSGEENPVTQSKPTHIGNDDNTLSPHVICDDNEENNQGNNDDATTTTTTIYSDNNTTTTTTKSKSRSKWSSCLTSADSEVPKKKLKKKPTPFIISTITEKRRAQILTMRKPHKPTPRGRRKNCKLLVASKAPEQLKLSSFFPVKCSAIDDDIMNALMAIVEVGKDDSSDARSNHVMDVKKDAVVERFHTRNISPRRLAFIRRKRPHASMDEEYDNDNDNFDDGPNYLRLPSFEPSLRKYHIRTQKANFNVMNDDHDQQEDDEDDGEYDLDEIMSEQQPNNDHNDDTKTISLKARSSISRHLQVPEFTIPTFIANTTIAPNSHEWNPQNETEINSTFGGSDGTRFLMTPSMCQPKQMSVDESCNHARGLLLLPTTPKAQHDDKLPQRTTTTTTENRYKYQRLHSHYRLDNSNNNSHHAISVNKNLQNFDNDGNSDHGPSEPNPNFLEFLVNPASLCFDELHLQHNHHAQPPLTTRPTMSTQVPLRRQPRPTTVMVANNNSFTRSNHDCDKNANPTLKNPFIAQNEAHEPSASLTNDDHNSLKDSIFSRYYYHLEQKAAIEKKGVVCEDGEGFFTEMGDQSVSATRDLSQQIKFALAPFHVLPTFKDSSTIITPTLTDTIPIMSIASSLPVRLEDTLHCTQNFSTSMGENYCQQQQEQEEQKQKEDATLFTDENDDDPQKTFFFSGDNAFCEQLEKSICEIMMNPPIMYNTGGSGSTNAIHPYQSSSSLCQPAPQSVMMTDNVHVLEGTKVTITNEPMMMMMMSRTCDTNGVTTNNGGNENEQQQEQQQNNSVYDDLSISLGDLLMESMSNPEICFQSIIDKQILPYASAALASSSMYMSEETRIFVREPMLTNEQIRELTQKIQMVDDIEERVDHNRVRESDEYVMNHLESMSPLVKRQSIIRYIFMIPSSRQREQFVRDFHIRTYSVSTSLKDSLCKCRTLLQKYHNELMDYIAEGRHVLDAKRCHAFTTYNLITKRYDAVLQKINAQISRHVPRDERRVRAKVRTLLALTLAYIDGNEEIEISQKVRDKGTLLVKRLRKVDEMAPETIRYLPFQFMNIGTRRDALRKLSGPRSYIPSGEFTSVQLRKRKEDPNRRHHEKTLKHTIAMRHRRTRP